MRKEIEEFFISFLTVSRSSKNILFVVRESEARAFIGKLYWYKNYSQIAFLLGIHNC